jgi:hypothetical protein
LNGNGIYTDLSNCQASCFCAEGTPPISEDFQSGLPSWTIINNDGSDTWEITNSAGYISSSSIYINNAEYSANGQYDDLILPTLDMTSNTITIYTVPRWNWRNGAILMTGV